MAYTITDFERLSVPGQSISTTRTQTEEGADIRSVAVNDGVTDLQIELEVIKAKLKAFGMIATVGMTIETENATTPDDSFVLTANEGVYWWTGETDIFPGTTTAFNQIFATNSSGTNGTLTIIKVEDPT